MAGTKQHRGLKRPRKPISFQLENRDSDNESNEQSALWILQRHLLLIDSIVRRAKNQHRSQTFLRHVLLLRGALRRLLIIRTKLEQLSTTKTAKSADEVRRKFEHEASLRGQREVIEEHLREVIVPKCYLSSSTVVADLPFANLGVVLIGLLSEIAAGKHGVGLPRLKDEEDELFVNGEVGAGAERPQGLLSDTDGPLLLGTSTRITGEDHGEVIERRYKHCMEVEYDTEPEKTAGMSPMADSAGEAVLAETDNSSGATGNVKEVSGDSSQAESTSTSRVEKPSVPQAKLKKTRKKNALDDLFSKLV